MKESLLILLLFPLVLDAQNHLITNIREHYNLVEQQIKMCQDAKNRNTCTLYCNELVINKHQTSWRAVGNYQKKIRFWYADDPNIQEVFEKKPGDVLLKVEITENVARREDYMEMLFRDGEMIFYFGKDLTGVSEVNEERFYFSDDKLIRYLEGKKDKTTEANEDQLLFLKNHASEMMALFLRLDRF